VGRFSVSVDGAVAVDKQGEWTLVAAVRGEDDLQDYPYDAARTTTANAATYFGSFMQ